ncbi:MAG: Ig-like domain-containing protein [Longimicrobiales bacterium]
MVHARFFPSARPLPILALALLLWSCTGDDAGIRRLPLEPSASPGKLSVSPASTTLAWIGATGRLTASVATADGGSVSGFKYSWRSLAPGVVTVDAEGRITSVQEGNAQVVGSILNLADTVDVVVKRLPAAIALTVDTVLVTEFETTTQLGATVRDGGGVVLETPVTWTSSDTAVARVSSSGLVTPSGGQGVATIAARAGGITKSARVRVKVGPSTVAVNPATVALTALGDTLRLSGTVLNARGDVLPEVGVTFKWVDTTVAHVTPDGLVRAVGVGSTSVTAVGDTVRRSVTVSVTQAPDSVSVSLPQFGALVPGASVDFSAFVFDRNNNAILAPNILWSSSDTAVATVTNAGAVKAVGAGTAFIKAVAGTSRDSVSITVLDMAADSVAVLPDSVAVDPGASTQLTARTFFEGTELLGTALTWSVDSVTVATVSPTGLVRGVKQGQAWVFARVAASGAVDSTRVTVNTPPSQFDIQLQYVGDSLPTVDQQAAFSAAAFVWENAIIGDLAPGSPNLEASACGVPHAAFNSLVDDLIIFVEVKAIDGVNGILAQAGPCVTRTSNGLALVGSMTFDSADMDALAAAGQLVETVVHEMGHVLGIGVGTPWSNILVGAGSADPYWPGTQSSAQFDLLGGVSINKVPVANTGGEGTRDAHWREATMGRELMTGFLNSGVKNPLSAISIAALQDMGYVVDVNRGETYTVGPSLRAAGPGLAIGRGEELRQPRFTLDDSGRLRAVR